MLTDDEKYIFSEKRTIDEVQSYTRTNAADIIAIGFDLKKTFIFSDYDYMGGAFYRNVTRISKYVTLNVARAVFGFNDRYGGFLYKNQILLILFIALALARFTLELSRVPPHSHPPFPISSVLTSQKPTSFHL